jgi:hypothetical protein
MMPSSNPETLSAVLDIVWKIGPKNILDVGAGYGKYGVLFREYMELKYANKDESIPMKSQRRIRIDALEGHAPYISQLHSEVYDHIYIDNITTFAENDMNYDLVFMGDVLEHLDKKEGEKVLTTLCRKAIHGILICVPKIPSVQGESFLNPLEIHRSIWRKNDFNNLAPFVYTGSKGSHMIIFMSENKNSYKLVHGNMLRTKYRLLKALICDTFV